MKLKLACFHNLNLTQKNNFQYTTAIKTIRLTCDTRYHVITQVLCTVGPVGPSVGAL